MPTQVKLVDVGPRDGLQNEATPIATEHKVELIIRNPGFLPPNFDLDAGIGLGNGLGLARTLLPRRGARIEAADDNDQVTMRLILLIPDVLDARPLPKDVRA